MGKGDDALRIIGGIVGKLKPIGGGELQSRAPYRNGDNPGAFNIRLTDGGDTVVWQDHVTGQGGGLKDLIALMPKELGHLAASNGNTPNHANVDMTTAPRDEDAPSDESDVIVTAPAPKSGAKVFASLEAYALDHGVSEQVFIAAGCSIMQHNGAAHIAFPMKSDVANPRLRRLDGGNPKWKPMQTGASPQLYGLDGALKIAAMYKTGYLVICNGQPSVIVAQHYDIPAFCITDGEGKPIPDALTTRIKDALTAQGYAIHIAADNDAPGRARGEKLHGLFWQHNPQVIQFNGEIDGFDLADHCKKHGDPARAKLKDYYVHLSLDRDKQQLQGLEQAVRELAKTNNPDKTDAAQLLVSRLQSQLDHVARSQVGDAILQPKAAGNACIQFNERYAIVKENPNAIMGLRSGIAALDMAVGGFQKGANIVFLAETGTGKTQLMASLANGLVSQAPGLIISMESPYVEFVNRMVAYRTRIPFGDIRRAQHHKKNAHGKWVRSIFNDDDVSKVRRAYGDIGTLERERQLIFTRPGSFSPNGLMGIAKHAKELHGIEWMIIDSLNNVMIPGMNDMERLTLAAVTSETIAISQDLVVFNTTQGGRSVKGKEDKRLGLHDARGSSQIEDKAFCHLSLINFWGLAWRGEMAESDIDTTLYPRGSAHLRINKLRDGAVENGMVITSCVGGCGFYNWQGR